MRQFIRFLAEQEGLSVLVSSHLLSEIQLLCDRVAIITRGTIIKTDTVQHLLSNRERVEWHVHPFEKGKAILERLTKVEVEENGTILTEYDGTQIAEWNKQLVYGGVEITEMNRKLPVLEELFLELTGGITID
jgi:ABC-2 type transport system ATP-binding protein